MEISRIAEFLSKLSLRNAKKDHSEERFYFSRGAKVGLGVATIYNEGSSLIQFESEMLTELVMIQRP